MPATTQLNYNPQPTTFPYTRSEGNPSIVNLSIQVTPNDLTQPLSCNAIWFKINIGDLITDLTSSTDAGKITAVCLQPDKWTIAKLQEGVYKATPIAPNTGFGIDETIVFQLQNINVNNEGPGSTPLQIADAFTGGEFIQHDLFKSKTSLNIDNFQAMPANVQAGGTVTLSWLTTAAAEVQLQPSNYYKLVSGKKVYNPPIDPNDSVLYDVLANTVFNLTAKGDGATVTWQFQVSVPPVIINYFNADPSQVNAGDMVTLSWEAVNANTCEITPGGNDFKNLPLKGNKTVQLWEDTNFLLTATSLAGTKQNAPAPVATNPVSIQSFTASPSVGVRIGDTVTLSWAMQSATSAIVNNQNVENDQLKIGNTPVQPSQLTIYQLMAQGKQGPQVRNVTVFPLARGWYQYSSHGPFGFTQRPVVLNFKNQIWAMAGGMTSTVYASVDGNTWIPQQPSANWPLRSDAAGIVFNNMIWLMGGLGNTAGMLNDVWNTVDGKTWNCITAKAGWSPRRSFGVFTLNNKLYVVGGIDASGNGLADVWSSADGVTWAQENANAFPNSKAAFATVAFDNKIWVLGGLNDGNETTGTPTNGVWWTSDGRLWNSANPISGQARYNLNAQAIGNYLYVSGGLNQQKQPIKDMSFMTANMNWSVTAGPAWSGNLVTSSVQYQNAFWFIGGYNDQNNPNKNIWAFAP